VRTRQETIVALDDWALVGDRLMFVVGYAPFGVYEDEVDELI
jgi:hypothetical protein